MQQALNTFSQKINRDCLEHKANKTDQAIQILTCILCSSKTSNAQMCPYCSKLSCEDCIKEWLQAKKKQCPSCKKPLKLSELVNCEPLAKKFYDTIEMLTKRQPEEELCKKHKLKMNYYCKNCRVPVCSDCAMLETLHKGHDYDKLANVVTRYEEQLKGQLAVLALKRKSFTSSLEKIEEQIIRLKEMKEEKNIQIEKLTNSLCDKTEQRFIVSVEKFNQQQTVVESRLQEMRDLHDNITKKMTACSKSRFLVEQQNLLKEVGQWDSEPPVQLLYMDSGIVSELVPEYEKKTFRVTNYSQKRKLNQVVYTDTLVSRDHAWRLKIYPNGNEDSEDMYISIFVELFEGIKEEVVRYKYKVDVLNQKIPERKISKQYESEFSLGVCWGYTTYAKIATLYDEGYVHPQGDYLDIVLHVKSPSYYLQVQDQNSIIELKKKRFDSNMSRICQLKSALRMLSSSSPLIKPSTVESVVLTSPTLQTFPEFHQPRELISLDEICEVAVQSQNMDDSPRIADEEIYRPVIKTERLETQMSQKVEVMKSTRNLIRSMSPKWPM